MPEHPSPPVRVGINAGPGRTLTAVYALFALAATGRSLTQLIVDPGKAPVAYALSAAAAVLYLVATGCLISGDRGRRLGIAACTIELLGVLVVGVLSYIHTDTFPDPTVWSHFGQGYGFIPLVLPVVGLWWLSLGYRHWFVPTRAAADPAQLD